MTRDDVNVHCATMPGAELSDPWGGGHDCWKVGGKMYASMGTMNAGVSIKCSDASEAAMLIDLGLAEPAPYLARGGWVLVRWGAMDADELKARLTRSYITVRRGLTKRVQARPRPRACRRDRAGCDGRPEVGSGARQNLWPDPEAPEDIGARVD